MNSGWPLRGLLVNSGWNWQPTNQGCTAVGSSTISHRSVPGARPATTHPVIGLITEWLDRTGQLEKRSEQSDLGGTMRLGGQPCELRIGTLAREIYGADSIVERHRHRYEVNNTLLTELEAKGLVVAGRAPGTDLCEMVELPNSIHPWFVACQFHPEFTSNPRNGHPLFISFVKAALAQQPEHAK